MGWAEADRRHRDEEEDEEEKGGIRGRKGQESMEEA